ncbi:MAG: hypothetical protein IJW98_03380, partial [Clostridia bacterium]|nr:hypothetical protein [Clostridia bacterium]
ITVAAMEAKTYTEALDFFDEYNLSAEGVSRREVKKIYKDIVTESFTYEKTEEVLANSFEGYEIQAKPLDSEGLKRVWMVCGWLGASGRTQTTESDGYEYVVLEREDATNGLQQLKGETVQWSIYPEEIHCSDIAPNGDKVAVCGRLPDDPEYTIRLAVFNEDSTLAWVKQYSRPFGFGNVRYPLYCTDDTITVIERDFDHSMWILTLDWEGNIIEDETVYLSSGFDDFEAVVRVGDDYLFDTGDRLLRQSGNRLEKLEQFGGDDWEYHFNGMVEFNGLVYLSGTKLPKHHNRSEGDAYDRLVEEYGKDGLTDEEVSKFYMENHTAILMICDPETGDPKSFYTIPGASGGKLTANGGRLDWEVNRYTEIESVYSEDYYQSSGNLAKISADKWQYVFSPYGQLVGEKDTGRSTEFEG